jgi:hypothetical protein
METESDELDWIAYKKNNKSNFDDGKYTYDHENPSNYAEAVVRFNTNRGTPVEIKFIKQNYCYHKKYLNRTGEIKKLEHKSPADMEKNLKKIINNHSDRIQYMIKIYGTNKETEET